MENIPTIENNSNNIDTLERKIIFCPFSKNNFEINKEKKLLIKCKLTGTRKFFVL